MSATRATPEAGPVPTFAVVGAVNHGKSSVVASLLEQDGVAISDMPGETTANHRFVMGELFALVDTPGFQNARKALDEIRADQLGGDPLDPFRRFVARHAGHPDFDAECRLLAPILDGAGILYVVDGSRPVRDLNLCEMELLRLTGRPRLAIINRISADDHEDDWKRRLNQHFNLVQAFDAQAVTYADRRALLESLALIERAWGDRLRSAVARLDADREERLDAASEAIAGMLVECLQATETQAVDDALDDAGRRRAGERLRARYVDRLVARERACHAALIALHLHRRLVPGALPPQLVAADLFAEETWELLGLNASQLVGLSAVAGGAAGLGIDAVAGGQTLGLAAAAGAAVGAGGAWMLGKRKPDIAVHWPTAMPPALRALLPGKALRLGGGTLRVGPMKAENFPWILLDRALAAQACAATRAHARRDDAPMALERMRPLLQAERLLVADWNDAERKACAAAFREARSGKPPSAARVAAMRATVRDGLARIAAREPELARAAASSAG